METAYLLNPLTGPLVISARALEGFELPSTKDIEQRLKELSWGFGMNLITLLQLLVDSGAVSPKAPTESATLKSRRKFIELGLKRPD